MPCRICKQSRVHVDCLLPWLLRGGSCPTCRTPLIRQGIVPEGEAEESDQADIEDDGSLEGEFDPRRGDGPKLFFWPCVLQMMHLLFGMLMFVSAAEFGGVASLPSPPLHPAPLLGAENPQPALAQTPSLRSEFLHPALRTASDIILLLYLATDTFMFVVIILTESPRQLRQRSAAPHIQAPRQESERQGEQQGEGQGEQQSEGQGEGQGEVQGEQQSEVQGEQQSEQETERQGEGQGEEREASVALDAETITGHASILASAPYLVLCGYVFMCTATAVGVAAILEGNRAFGIAASPSPAVSADLRGFAASTNSLASSAVLQHMAYLISAQGILFLYAVPAILSPCPLWRIQYLCLSLIYGLLVSMMRATADTAALLAVQIGVGSLFFSVAAAAGV